MVVWRQLHNEHDEYDESRSHLQQTTSLLISSTWFTSGSQRAFVSADCRCVCTLWKMKEKWVMTTQREKRNRFLMKWNDFWWQVSQKNNKGTCWVLSYLIQISKVVGAMGSLWFSRKCQFVFCLLWISIIMRT